MVFEAQHILHVESDPVFADLVKGLLESNQQVDISIIRAGSLAEALSLLASEQGQGFDLIYAGTELPGSQGLEIIRSLRAAAPGLPLVVLDRVPDPQVAGEAFRAGADDYLESGELSASLLFRVSGYALERRDCRNNLMAVQTSLACQINQRTQELESYQDQWKQIFDAVPDMIAILNPDFSIREVNRAMTARLGKLPGEVKGKVCREAFLCNVEPEARCPHAMLMKDGKEHMVELSNHGLGDNLLVSVSPLYDFSGKLTGAVHVARDVSAVKEAEQTAREQLELGDKIMEAIPNPVFVKDREGRFIKCNTAFERFLGVERGQILGKTVWHLSPERMAGIYQQKDRELFENPGVQIYENQIVRPDGIVQQVIFNKATFQNSQGEVTGIVGVILDITERRKAERALEESEKRYRLLLESLKEGLIQVDSDLRIVFLNKAFTKMMGYEAEELLGSALSDYTDQANKAILAKEWEKRKKGEQGNYELTLINKSGKNVIILISTTPLSGPDGEFLGSLALMNDITDRKVLEQQLMQAQKLEAIGQLAAGIAHEINTPTQFVSSNTAFLNDSFWDLEELITSFADLLDDLSEDEKWAETSAGIINKMEEIDYEFLRDEIPKAIKANMEGLERISKIVRSMKEFAHPGESEKQPSDINKAIENTIMVARNEWKYVAEVETDLDPELPLVKCMQSEINQVFLNLIVNAAQAIGEIAVEGVDEKKKIRISTKGLGDRVKITINDEGPGIPGGIGEKVFEPFFTTKPPGKGTGQGLAIAHHTIVQTHKGTLFYSSEQGKGATFTITLPVDEVE